MNKVCDCGASLACGIASECHVCGSESVSWCFACGKDICSRCGATVAEEQECREEKGIAWVPTLCRIGGCLSLLAVVCLYVGLIAVEMSAGHYFRGAMWAAAYVYAARTIGCLLLGK